MGYVCPYHGWSFDNAGQLTAMADAPEAYKGRVDLGTLTWCRRALACTPG